MTWRSGQSLALVVLTVTGCATSGPYVWADEYRGESGAAHPPPGYVIQPGDTIQVRVFNQPDMSTRARVRDDGKVSVPFLNDVTAVGITPNALAQQLQVRLKEYINAPVVTVSLEEARPFAVAVMGEVARPGVYQVPPDSGVIQALAAAGGFTPYAGRDKIFVLREAPERVRIRFVYNQLTQSEGKSASFRLRPGDAVVVE